MKIFKTLLLLITPYLALSQHKEVAKNVPVKNLQGNVQTELIRGPYLQMATSNSMTVRRRTAVYDRSRVKYGLTSDNLNMQTDDSTLVSEHFINLSGLKPYTKYYYSISNLSDVVLQGEALVRSVPVKAQYAGVIPKFLTTMQQSSPF